MKLLALTPGHRMHREQLMDALWPDRLIGAAAANLRKAVHFARRSLGSETAVATRGDMVELWPGGELIVDVERFEAASQAAIASGEVAAFDAAAALDAGELLPEDRFAEWALERRDRVRALRLHVLSGAGRWEEVLAMDPANEPAHRALMRVHLENGNRQMAMRQFERLRELLRADLGVGPGDETVALYERAVATAGAAPPSPVERSRLLLARGLVHWNRQDLRDAERAAQEARSVAIAAGLGRELGEASCLLGLVASARGTWGATFRNEFIEFVTSGSDLATFVFDAHLCLADFSLYGDNWRADVTALARELLDVAESAGSLAGRALPTMMLGEVELLLGRLDEADRLLGHAAALHEQAGAVSGQVLSLQRLAESSIASGRRWQAGRILSKARRLAEGCELISHLLVRIFGAMIEATSDPRRRVGVAKDLEQRLVVTEVCDPCSMGFRIAAATACARSKDLAAARRYIAESERIAGLWQGGPWVAATWEARAELRQAEGDPAQAAALFREAADLFATVDRSLEAARCRAAAERASS